MQGGMVPVRPPPKTLKLFNHKPTREGTLHSDSGINTKYQIK